VITALKAAAEYFGIMFVLGMLLGTARTFLLQPILGATAAVAVELPLMLAAAWIACALVIRHFRLSARVAERSVMGFSAFLLLLLGEAVLSLLVGRTLSEHFSLYRQPDAQLGLIGQIAFAAFPLVQGRAGEPR
jgi:hypothetical protein